MDILGIGGGDESSKGGKMADATNPKSCLRWMKDEETVQRQESYGTGKQGVFEALDAQQHRTGNVNEFKRTIDRVSGENREEVQAAFEDLKLVSNKRLECLQEVATVACLEDLVGVMTSEFSEKASALVGHLSSQPPLLPEGEAKGLQAGAQTCILAVQRNWSWLGELVQCADKHLQNASTFHQFYHTVYEYSSWMPLQLRAAINKVCLRPSTKGSNWEAQVLLLDLKELMSVFLSWQIKLNKLYQQAQTVVPVQLRTKTMKYFRPMNAMVDYTTKEMRVKKGEELLLLDNSNSADWLVRNVMSEESRVPSIICCLPGPDTDAIQAALKIQLELLEIWTDNVKRVGKDIILFMILVLRDWTDAEMNILKAMTFDKKDLIKSRFSEVIQKLQPYWEDFSGFREVKERVRTLNGILAKDGQDQDRNEEYTEEFVDRATTVGDLVVTFDEMWKQWDTYRLLLQSSKAPEYMLLVERLDQLKYMDMEELRRMWQAQLQMSPDDNESFEEWLQKQQGRWRSEGGYPAGGIGRADGYGAGQGPYSERNWQAKGAWKYGGFGGGAPAGFGSSSFGFSRTDYEMGPDGRPVVGPDGRPVAKGGSMPYLLGPDGQPVVGPNGRPIPAGSYQIGPDGWPVMGEDGWPIPCPWLIGPDGEKVTGPDGKPIPAGNWKIGADGWPVMGPDGWPVLAGPPNPWLIGPNGRPIIGPDGCRILAGNWKFGADGWPIMSSDGWPELAGGADPYLIGPDGTYVLGQDGQRIPAGNYQYDSNGFLVMGSDGWPLLEGGVSAVAVREHMVGGYQPDGSFVAVCPGVTDNAGGMPSYSQVTTTTKTSSGGGGTYGLKVGKDGVQVKDEDMDSGRPLDASGMESSSSSYSASYSVSSSSSAGGAGGFKGGDSTDGQMLQSASAGMLKAETVGSLGAAAPGQKAHMSKVSGSQKKSVTETSTTEYHSGEQEVRKTFVITGVVNPKNKEVVSMHKAVMLGIIDSAKGTYNDNGNHIPIPVAMSAGLIKVEFTETKKTEEKKHDIGLITLKMHKESRPYSVKAVIDASNDERLTVDQAIRHGIVDQRRGLYINLLDKTEISLSDALDLGLLVVEFDSEAEVSAPEEVTKTYAIHAIVDQKRKERVSFSEAVRMNLLDKETGAYFHNVDNEYMYVGDAIRRGFIKATVVDDPNSMDIDPENRMVVEKVANLRRKLLTPMRALSAMKKAAASLGK